MKLGFSVLPSLIFRAQGRLGLNPTQLAVLLQIADYWWDQERKPYPGKNALSERLGLSARQIQRHIADLEAAGLVKRIERRAAHRGKLSNAYDLSGLVEKLKKLEPEFRQVQEMKRQVTRRGGLARYRQQDAKKAD
jgi:predicted transcriptional regulator